MSPAIRYNLPPPPGFSSNRAWGKRTHCISTATRARSLSPPTALDSVGPATGFEFRPRHTSAAARAPPRACPDHPDHPSARSNSHSQRIHPVGALQRGGLRPSGAASWRARLTVVPRCARCFSPSPLAPPRLVSRETPTIRNESVPFIVLVRSRGPLLPAHLAARAAMPLLPLDEIQVMFADIRTRAARSSGRSVLIFAAADVDSICACRIFTVCGGGAVCVRCRESLSVVESIPAPRCRPPLSPATEPAEPAVHPV